MEDHLEGDEDGPGVSDVADEHGPVPHEDAHRGCARKGVVEPLLRVHLTGVEGSTGR